MLGLYKPTGSQEGSQQCGRLVTLRSVQFSVVANLALFRQRTLFWRLVDLVWQESTGGIGAGRPNQKAKNKKVQSKPSHQNPTKSTRPKANHEEPTRNHISPKPDIPPSVKFVKKLLKAHKRSYQTLAASHEIREHHHEQAIQNQTQHKGTQAHKPLTKSCRSHRSQKPQKPPTPNATQTGKGSK